MIHRSLLAGSVLLALSATAGYAQMSNNVIKIGVLNDRNGLFADLAGEGSVVAARMAAAEFGNVINGVPIQIVSADHQNKPDIAASAARQWIDAEQVDVVADVPNSATALAVQAVTRDKKRIFLMSGPGSTELIGKSCSPYGFQWTFNTSALANVAGAAIVAQGKTSWFFLTADYAFGHSLEAETAKVVKEKGGKVLGSVRHPIGTTDMSSFLLQAQASGAQVIGLANAGGDTITAVKQAAEFGIGRGGQTLAGLLLYISDIHALGLKDAQGLLLTTAFYWDLNDQTRAWAKAFMEKFGKAPTAIHAGVYSSVRHYLAAVKAAGTDDADIVAKKMRETPINDMMMTNGRITPTGSVLHAMYLARVKSPAESRGPWDYYEIVKTVPAEQAYAAPADSGCALVQ